MAASRISSNSPDVVDLVAVIEAFQEINNCVITLRGRVEPAGGRPSLTFLVEAHDKKSEIGEAPTLGWVRCVIGSSQHATMESAILWSLYQLDGQIAATEMGKTDHGA